MCVYPTFVAKISICVYLYYDYILYYKHAYCNYFVYHIIYIYTDVVICLESVQMRDAENGTAAV